ncbi:B2 protein-like [Sitophilus oryzae]|uniref:B2 protein-like n=1 Tax=Sitophilus oryzae TaxID=7048 RepID=A0A6J2YLF2_SITOR|nr:B2 protein-like [Sitophilus oryzae]
MKAFVAAVVLISVAICVHADLSDEQKQKVQAYGKECITESGVDKELVTKARQGTFSDDAKLKAFAYCVSKKIGFQDGAGAPQPEVIKQKLSGAINNPEAADKLIAKCVQSKATPEDTALETFKCYYENTPTHISVF